MNRRPVIVEWDPQMPREVRSAAEPHFDRWKHLLPGWIDEVRFGWDADDSNNAMSATTHPEYRFVRFMVKPYFLQAPEWSRSDSMLHEIVHTPIQPLVNLLDSVVNATKASPDAANLAREMIRAAMEGAVCDLTSMILAADGTRDLPLHPQSPVVRRIDVTPAVA